MPIASKHWHEYTSLLSNDLREQSSKYLRWQDRHAYVFGKLLLMKGLAKLGIDKDIMSTIQYNKYGRPFLKENIDFNISHSGEYVICAIGKNMRLGVDIETIKEIEFHDFHNVMTRLQWEHIKGAANPLKSFFSFWTIKESVIKADGRGLSIPLLDIHINNNMVQYKSKAWHLQELRLSNDTCAFLASNIRDSDLRFTEIDFFHGIREVNIVSADQTTKSIIKTANPKVTPDEQF